jgi:hypothetical protein
MISETRNILRKATRSAVFGLPFAISLSLSLYSLATFCFFISAVLKPKDFRSRDAEDFRLFPLFCKARAV